MPTTISNPATFSSVRTAFNTEGYGLSTSFKEYVQGGTIVPATSTFNIIGAGTSGDPLRLTQFNGFTVPTKGAIVTSGSTFSEFISGSKGTPSVFLSWNGYSDGSGGSLGYSKFNSSFNSVSGTVNGYTVNVCGWALRSPEDLPTTYTIFLKLTGNFTSARSLQIDGVTVTNSRSGTFSSGYSTYEWLSNNGDTVPTTDPFNNKSVNIALI